MGPVLEGPLSAVLDPVQGLYERFPYPRAETDLDPVASGERAPIWSPDGAFHAYFPDRPKRRDLDVLVAGCGTNLAPALAAHLPEARVVGIDISDASLAIARGHQQRHRLDNLELVRLPLEDVAALGREFDLVQCTGVLHHLVDPVAGLRALGEVTRVDGALMIMVYARYGRQGVYQVQELCRRLGLGPDEAGARATQRLVQHLPADHAFRRIHPAGGAPICLEEIADLLLHPRDIAYTVPGVRDLVDGAGLALHRFLGHAEYTPSLSVLGRLGLAEVADPWEAAAVAELFHGSLIKHRFVLTNAGRPSARELIARAAPSELFPALNPDVSVRPDGDAAVLVNPTLQVPAEVRVGRAMLQVLRHADGSRSVESLAAGWPGGATALAATLRQLYLVDVLLFEVRSAAGAASAG